MKPLKSCVNGCDAPVQWPSKVLCKKCLDELNEKFKRLDEAHRKKAKALGIKEES